RDGGPRTAGGPRTITTAARRSAPSGVTNLPWSRTRWLGTRRSQPGSLAISSTGTRTSAPGTASALARRMITCRPPPGFARGSPVTTASAVAKPPLRARSRTGPVLTAVARNPTPAADAAAHTSTTPTSLRRPTAPRRPPATPVPTPTASALNGGEVGLYGVAGALVSRGRAVRRVTAATA